MLYKIVVRNRNCNTWNGQTTQKPQRTVINLSNKQIKNIFKTQEKDSISFLYDYGDGWTDEILVVKVDRKESNQIKKDPDQGVNTYFLKMLLDKGYVRNER